MTFHHSAAPPAFPNTLNFQDVSESAQSKLDQMDAWLQGFPAPPQRTGKELGVPRPNGGRQYVYSILSVPVKSQGPDWNGGEADGSEVAMKCSHP